jgi:tRNA U34 5-carboxymethylaminomethyl modifying enzyme MnmG/GidA
MKRARVSTSYYLIIGLILFPLALLMLVRQPTFMSLISQLMPSSSTTDLFGVILLFLGEGAIAFGIIGQVAGKIVASAEQDRLIYANAISRTMDQQTAMSTAIRNVQDQVSQANQKIQQMHTLAMSTQYQRQPVLANCKFCGAAITEGRFCPSCGRAQT